MIDLREINMVNGVNEKGEPFITITAVGKDNTMILGQLSPKELRDHGFAAIACAEAAEQDAATFQTLKDVFDDDKNALQLAGLIITKLRELREL